MSRGAAQRRFALANRAVLLLRGGWHNCCNPDAQGRLELGRGVRSLPVTRAVQAASRSHVTLPGPFWALVHFSNLRALRTP